jgi:alpha-galactosidase
MKHYGNRVEELKIAYIGGGSRGWAWTLMSDLARADDISGTVYLYDIDFDAAKRNEKIGNSIPHNFGYKAAETLPEALKGADFVVISILPGTFDEMESDVHWPERYGIYQSVGDTTGPGGILRAMRTVPMFETIALAIKENCPDAWVINYTNPMTLCVRTLYEVFPEVKAFGCCHEVFGTQKLLCAMLKENTGIEAERHELYTTVTGINHFTWLTAASWQGEDLFPAYARFAEKYAETGYQTGSDNWMNSHFACAHRVKIDLFRRYGAIAAAGDRHLAEFTAPRYTRDPETVRRWMFSLTPVSWRKQDLAERLRKSEALVSGKEKPDMKPSGEEGHLLMKALLGLGDLVSNVNLPNRGQIPNLPLGAVVETNARFARDRIDPLSPGPLPDSLLPLISRHAENQGNTLDAALRCDRELGFATFMNDPQLAGVSPEEGRKLFDDMLRNQRAFLPAGWGLR